jgi:hypothetical protein
MLYSLLAENDIPHRVVYRESRIHIHKELFVDISLDLLWIKIECNYPSAPPHKLKAHKATASRYVNNGHAL